MIKEIEVGGVKHSITLADDMIGSGLNRDANGSVSVNVSHGLTISSGPNSSLSVDVEGLCGYGLTSDGTKIVVSTDTIAGSGLDGSYGTISLNPQVGSGLAFIKEEALFKLNFMEIKQLLFSSGDYTSLGSGLRETGEGRGNIEIDPGSGLQTDSEHQRGRLSVRVASRSSGLRLFLNPYGQLDVTQD